MTAEIMRGAPAAAALTERLKARVASLANVGVRPRLAIVRVGEKPDDVAYESAAIKRCASVGVDAASVSLPDRCTARELTEAIERIDRDDATHGCLVLRPFADESLDAAACAALAPAKDVDCMTDESFAGIMASKPVGFPPCTARACVEILDHYGVEIRGARAVIVGRSLVVGRPLAMMLLARDATVTICHTATRDLADVCREADILIAAAGRASLIGADHVRPGAVVLDVGINAAPDGSLCGDVDFSAAASRASLITPVPGGVGAMTTAVLASHVVEAAERSCAKK